MYFSLLPLNFTQPSFCIRYYVCFRTNSSSSSIHHHPKKWNPKDHASLMPHPPTFPRYFHHKNKKSTITATMIIENYLIHVIWKRISSKPITLFKIGGSWFEELRLRNTQRNISHYFVNVLCQSQLHI